MKYIRNFTSILVAILIIAQAALSALTNYATVKIPEFFTINPKLLLLAIVFCVIVVIYTSIQLSKTTEQKSPDSPTDSRIDDINSNDRSITTQSSIPDIFISYSHHDKEWVHKVLVPKLEKHGFSVLIDTKFFAGKFGLLQIEDGVQYCKRTIAVLTPEYIQGEWTILESAMAQSLDPATRQRKLIPILLKETNLPPRFGVIHYRDFTSIDKDKWNLLIRDLI